ncbi:hypothetical protein [Mucilaginibacter sp. UYCu711]
MEKDQPEVEKKIWVDPVLTLMPMKKIESHNAIGPHELAGDDDIASGS